MNPPQEELAATASEHGILPIVHLEPFYGNPGDAPARPPVFAGLEFRVPVDSIASLPAIGCGPASSGPGQLERLQTAGGRHQVSGCSFSPALTRLFLTKLGI